MLEFRLGFLCARRDDTPSDSNEAWKVIRDRWTKYEIGGFSIWADPQLPMARRGNESRDVIVLGDVFSLNGQPLSEVIDGFLGANAWSPLDLLGGRFAVLIISSDRCQVAHDAFGSRSVFYLTGARFSVASHAALLARAYGVGRAKDVADFMQLKEFRKRTVKYLPGDATVYRDMHALVPNNYLDSEGNVTKRYWPIRSMKRATCDDFHQAVETYFNAFVPFIASRYEPIFGITGGVDSRAVYCAFRKYGVSFRGVTWGAGYLQPAEEPIVKSIVSSLKIRHKFLDPRKYTSDKVGAAAALNGGNFRGPSALTEAMGAEFGNDGSAAFVRGYGGEIMRGFYNLRARPMQDLSVGTLTGAYGSSMRGVKPGTAYLDACANFFSGFRERANYGGLEVYRYDPNDIFYWEHRMGMWGSAMLNEMDPAVYSLVGFNSRQLYETTFSMNPKERLKKQLLKDIIARHDEELSLIPYE